MNHRAQQHPVKRFLNRYPQVIAYLGLIIVFFFTLWLDNENQKNDEARSEKQALADEKERCRAGVDTRDVDRDQTQRIYVLATSTLPKDTSSLTKDEMKRLREYIEQVESFRNESFATIKPSSLCAPYVDDDVVTPEEWEKQHPPNDLGQD